MHVEVDEVTGQARELAQSLYARWSPQDRDDLVQDVMLRYVRTFGDGSGPDNCAAWLTTVLRNTARNLHAHRERRPEVLERDDDPLGALAAASSTRLASLMPVRGAIIDEVLDLIEDERTRSVLRLKYLDNLSSREIGEHLRLPVSTVDQVASRGKRRLREALAERPDLVEELRRLHPRTYAAPEGA